jgi:hypothetical protein
MKNNYFIILFIFFSLVNTALLVVILINQQNFQPVSQTLPTDTNQITGEKKPNPAVQNSDKITFNSWEFQLPSGWQVDLINEFRLGLDQAPFEAKGEMVGSINLSTYNNNYNNISEAKDYFVNFHSTILEEKEITVDGYPAIQFRAEGYQGKPSPDTADMITYIDGPNGVLAIELIQPQYEDMYEQIISSLHWRLK